MSVLNQAHVEAICSATYLENYLDCLDALPDDLQRVLTQIREVDVKMSDLEKDTISFEDVLVNLKDGDTPDSFSVLQLHQKLLRMQEYEDEKIQLSNSLMEFIENRVKQLESDRENLDPSNHIVNDAPPSRTNNSQSKRINNSDTKNSTVQSSASTQSVDSSKDSNKQVENRSVTSSAKKRKPKMESPAVSNKPSLSSKSNHSSITHSNASSQSKDIKEETPAKKHSTPAQEETKPAAKVATKRKRRSRAGNHTKSQKEVSIEPMEPEEPTYCVCDQVSYGEMIGCDNDVCPREWFHFSCVNLTNKPKGKWFCPQCRGDKQTVMRRGADKVR